MLKLIDCLIKVLVYPKSPNVLTAILLHCYMLQSKNQSTALLAAHQGSHSSWKTWKNGDSFSSLEKSWNFVIFAKYPGKMRQTLEI